MELSLEEALDVALEIIGCSITIAIITQLMQNRGIISLLEVLI